MKKVEVRMVVEKETKGTFRYKQDDTEDELFVPGVSVIYLGKELTEQLGDGNPQTVLVTIEAA